MSLGKLPYKVLFVDHTPFAGGAQLVLAEHLAELDKHQYEAHVACTDTVPDLVRRYQAAGATIHLLSLPRLRGKNPVVVWHLAKSVYVLRRLIRRHGFDLVVTNTTRAAYIGTLAAWGTQARVVWWVRDFLYPRRLFRLLRPLADGAICVSQAVKAAYMADNDPFGTVIYVASSLYKQFPVSEEAIKRERQRWGLAEDDIVVGFMGRLVAEKGAEDVAEAVWRLGRQFPRLKALIVGTGRGQQHDIEGQLKAWVHSHGLDGRIILAGYQSDEALYYALFDMFVLPTRDREPFATSVIQAMMAGKPVIGTNAGGTPEIIEDGKTGLLYPPGEGEALAERIAALLSDGSLARRLAQAGQERVLQYHREEVVTDQLERLYRQVLPPS